MQVHQSHEIGTRRASVRVERLPGGNVKVGRACGETYEFRSYQDAYDHFLSGVEGDAWNVLDALEDFVGCEDDSVLLEDRED